MFLNLPIILSSNSFILPIIPIFIFLHLFILPLGEQSQLQTTQCTLNYIVFIDLKTVIAIAMF